MSKEQQTTEIIRLPTAEEMLAAGIHFGHRTAKWDPKMKPYIFTTKNNVHIFDLEKTREKFKEALEFLAKTAGKGGVILLVGTSAASKKITKDLALECLMPYITERWIGGTLTNFRMISKRLEHFRDLENKRASGELKKYTKKEQHDFDQELIKLEKRFGGIKQLTKIPDALFIFNAKENDLAIREARRAGVKIAALCDTNMNPDMIDYPIPANDDALAGLELMAKYIEGIIKENKRNAIRLEKTPSAEQRK